MEPGEIIVSNVEVEQLSSEEIQELGLNLDDPENYNYYQFSFNIQFSEDEPPQEVTTVIQSSSVDPVPVLPSDSQCQIKVVIERVVDPTAEFCAGRYRWRRSTLCDDDTIHVSTFSLFPFYLFETLPEPCSDSDGKVEEVFYDQLGCKVKKVSRCPLEFDPSPGGPSGVGGVVTPSADVSIP